MFINKRFSCITQLNVKAFYTIITAVLLSNIGVMAGEDLLSRDSRFKCVKKEEGAPITATALFDNGRSAICGDKEGTIYRINSYGCEKIVSLTPPRPIDSIVIGNALMGNFCFTAGGEVYDYKENKVVAISENLQEEVKRLYMDDSNNEIYAVTKDGNVYCLSGEGNDLDWKAVTSETAKKILKNSVSDPKSNNLKDKIPQDNDTTSYADSHGKVVLGTSNGQIYVSDLYDQQSMTAKADYISEAVGADADRVIYRVTIDGYKLNTDDIFNKGYNGFKYTLSSDDHQYDKDAYPLTGVTYHSDGEDNSSLQNREISFLWLGPKCAIAGDHKLTVRELSYNFSTDTKDQLIDTVTIDLPPATQLPDYSNYFVVIKTEDGGSAIIAEPNGSCGVPFNVLLREGEDSGPILPADDKYYDTPAKNPYNHLVFYTTDGSHAKSDGLISCDPYSSSPEFIAILPSSSTELDGKYVKYGILGKNCKALGGKTFYSYVKADGLHRVFAGLVHNGELKGFGSADLTITGKTDPVAIASDYGINNPGGRTFTFSGGVSGSNWQGNQWGYGGYLDYQLTDYKNELYRGIFVYLPEGLNIRDIDARKDLRSSSLKIGYYFDPQAKSESPLTAVNYHINDTPSYCDKMRNQELYAVLFDQYGRCAINYGKINGGDAAKDLWDNREKGTKSDRSKPLKMLMQVGNFYNVPIIMGSTSNSKENNHGVTQRGLFVPPITSGVNATFMTDISVWTKDGNDGNDGTYVIEGYKLEDPLATGNKLFNNTLTVKHYEPCIDESIGLTATGDFPALNAVRILPMDWLGSDWLDSWTVFHVNPVIGNRYEYWYGFYQGAFCHDFFGLPQYFHNFTSDGYYYVYNQGYLAEWIPFDRAWNTLNVPCPSDTSIPKPVSIWPLVK